MKNYHHYVSGEFSDVVTAEKRNELTKKMKCIDQDGWPFEPYAFSDDEGVEHCFAPFVDVPPISISLSPLSDQEFSDLFGK